MTQCHARIGGKYSTLVDIETRLVPKKEYIGGDYVLKRSPFFIKEVKVKISVKEAGRKGGSERLI